MGLGKTFCATEKLKEFEFEYCLIICQKSMVETWKRHLETFYNYKIIDYTKPKVNLEQGIILINYDLIWRRPEFLKLKNLTVILDESSLISNSQAKRTKYILKLKIENLILLSGTPVSGKYENLWSQLKLLGYKEKQSLFLDRFVNFNKINVNGFPIKIVDKQNPYKNVDELKQLLGEHGAIFKRTDECFDLPPQNFIDIKVKPTTEYKKFLTNSIVEIGGTIFVGDTHLTKLLYSRQLCSAFNKHKLSALEDLINSTNDRLIVFYNFNVELNSLLTICKRANRPISQVNGHLKDLDAYERENNSVTLCQFQAASMGLNLQKANKMIYLSPTLKCEEWMQSLKRIHRINQNNPCHYYKLICDNSVEEQIYETLKRGEDYTLNLFERDVT